MPSNPTEASSTSCIDTCCEQITLTLGAVAVATDSQTSRVVGYAQTSLLTAFVVFLGMVAPVAAQSSEPVGSGICGTPLANTINQAAPLVVGILMIGGAILSYVLHNAAGFPKDPQAVQAIKNWRNRAAFASVTTPLFALIMQMFIGFTGVGLANCVDIVPFF
ncbi:hypothetical protein [Halomarina pelagica]|uniref:hypothetical protein n=1 Tax=Halomarina pelagica TaxID=2961599 RepID=UPI0020C3CD8B|nr:hypothetical protein [Halomarina sp. BND7]